MDDHQRGDGGALPPIASEVLAHSPNDVVLAIDPAGTVAWVSDSCRSVMGWAPDDLIGRGALELLHPDELDRALAVIVASTQGFAPRSTARYRIRSADGSWVECDLSVAALGTPEAPGGLAVWIRLANDQLILREVVGGLLADSPVDEVLATLVDLVFSRNDVSRCTVGFTDAAGRRVAAGSELPPSLVGLASVDGDDPWARAWALGEEAILEPPAALPPGVAATAEAEGLGALWVVPVTDEVGTTVATITTWTVVGGPSPRLNTYAVTLLGQLVELVLRWRRQVHDLRHAAEHDPLTGLANRRVLDELTTPTPAAGTGPDPRHLTVLSLDLDGFKPINDTHGHAIGDRVLQVVASRLRAAVRNDDVVLRVGGDEFVVLCFDTALAEARDLADRVRHSLGQPMEVDGEALHVTTSIGLASGPAGQPGLLEQADAALYRAKTARNAVVVA